MSETDSDWSIPVGSVVRRAEVHHRYGGNAQAGIAPCRDHPHILLFTDSTVGPEHGYFAEWAEDGTFHYTGQGQHGDQVFDRANKAVRGHHEQHRSLRLFETTAQAGFCRYLGEFEVDPVDPYHLDRAPGAGDRVLRTVIVFHLVPVGPAWSSREDSLGLVEQRTVPVADPEAADAEQHLARLNVDAVEKERRESELLIRYAEHLRQGGASITRRTTGRAPPARWPATPSTKPTTSSSKPGPRRPQQPPPRRRAVARLRPLSPSPADPAGRPGPRAGARPGRLPHRPGHPAGLPRRRRVHPADLVTGRGSPRGGPDARRPSSRSGWR